jgi:hypothetical protein
MGFWRETKHQINRMLVERTAMYSEKKQAVLDQRSLQESVVATEDFITRVGNDFVALNPADHLRMGRAGDRLIGDMGLYIQALWVPKKILFRGSRTGLELREDPAGKR